MWKAALGLRRQRPAETTVVDILHDIKYTSDYIKSIKRLSKVSGSANKEFYQTVFHRFFRDVLGIDYQCDILCYKLMSEGPLALSDDEIQFLFEFIINFREHLTEVLSGRLEVLLWSQIGLHNLYMIDISKRDELRLHINLLKLLSIHNKDLSKGCKGMILRSGISFFWKTEEDDFREKYISLVVNVLDTIRAVQINDVMEIMDYTPHANPNIYHLRALGLLFEADSDQAGLFLSKYLDQMVAVITFSSTINCSAEIVLRHLSTFLKALFEGTYLLRCYQYLERSIFQVFSYLWVNPESSEISPTFRNLKNKQPLCEIFEIISLIAPYTGYEWEPVLRKLVTKFTKLMLSDMFQWESKVKASLIKAMRMLFVRLGKIEKVNTKKSFDDSLQFIRTEEEMYREDELDTVYLTPMLHLLTRSKVPYEVRYEALLFVGVLGAIDPEVEQHNVHESVAPQEQRSPFSDQLLLAIGERWTHQAIDVKSAFEHSGFVRFDTNKFSLPTLPSEKQFNLQAIILILIEMLEFQELSENDTICVLDSLALIIKMCKREYSIFVAKTQQVLLQLLRFDDTPDDFKVNESILNVLYEIPPCFKELNDFENQVDFLTDVISPLFYNHVSSSCRLLKSYLDRVVPVINRSLINLFMCLYSDFIASLENLSPSEAAYKKADNKTANLFLKEITEQHMKGDAFDRMNVVSRLMYPEEQEDKDVQLHFSVVQSKELKGIIKFLKDEVGRLKKREPLREEDLIGVVQGNKTFLRKFCTSLLRNSGNNLLRLCIPIAQKNSFAAEELFNVALSNIIHNFSASTSEKRYLLLTLRNLFMEMVEKEPSRRHILTDFAEYGERGMLRVQLFEKDYIADLSEKDRHFSKAIRMLEQTWLNNGEMSDGQKIRLLKYYNTYNMAAYVSGTAKSFEKEAKSKEEQSVFSTMVFCFDHHVSEKDAILDILNKFLAYRRGDYKSLYGVVLEAMCFTEAQYGAVLNDIYSKAQQSHTLNCFKSHYERMVKKLLSNHLNIVNQHPKVLREIYEYRKGKFPFETSNHVNWIKLAKKFRKVSNMKAFTRSLKRLGVEEGTFKLIDSNDSKVAALKPEISFELIKFWWAKRKKNEEVTDVYGLVYRCLKKLIKNLERDGGNVKLLVKLYLKLAKISFNTYFPMKSTRKKPRQATLQQYSRESYLKKSNILEEVQSLLLRAKQINPSKLKVHLRLSEYYTFLRERRMQALNNYGYLREPIVFSSSDRIAQLRFHTETTVCTKLFQSLLDCMIFGQGAETMTAALKFFNIWSSLDDDVAKYLGKLFFIPEKLGTVILQCLPLFSQLVSIARKIRGESRTHIFWFIKEIVCTYPDFAIFPFLVATRRRVLLDDVSEAALEQEENFHSGMQQVLIDLRSVHSNIVDEACIFIREMSKVGITQVERWYHSISQARKFYDGNLKDLRKMEFVLLRQRDIYEENIRNIGPIEATFLRIYRKDMEKVFEILESFRRTGLEQILVQIWDFLGRVFHDAENFIKERYGGNSLDRFSTYLANLKTSNLIVPGSCLPNSNERITIAGFKDTVHILDSKQRPRKIVMIGSNGREYPFLLKGFEDLRQDKLILQTFGLTNLLIRNTKLGKANDLSLLRYPVIPLSTEVGLIGWVERAQTFQHLLSQYRKKCGVEVYSEINQLYEKKEYQQASDLEKKEIFLNIYEEYQGMDLADLLLCFNQNSHVWLKKRNNFIFTFAVNSMLGYLLGIGDRHPSNLLVGFDSGKLMHIDFGDSFGRALYREVQPELVPFRHTRMFQKCLGVQERLTFQYICEHTLKVLRKNQDLILSLLEPLLYDPLEFWFEGFLPAIHGMLKLDVAWSAPFCTVDLDEDQLKDNLYSESAGLLFSSNIYSKYRIQSGKKILNKRVFAEMILHRVKKLLNGNELLGQLSVDEQADLVINRAKDMENIRKMYLGWAPFW